uniref:Williams-Beuren syndrome chromosomal region 16 protein homolog n=1 Tax=Sinocyclocheilus rhinocerous TaxID=307959 RepID=A0A673GR44_9TELE
MALVSIRSCGRHGFHLGLCAYATRPVGTPRKREQQDDTPVFQYVGQHRRPQGKVFVWGFSYTGALGIPSFVVPDSGRKKPRKYQLTPYRLDTEQKISSAACGYGFTLLACNSRDLTKLWGMGLNKDSQLGFQRTQHDRHKSYDYVLEPSPVSLPLVNPQETRVLQVSCGRAHSLVLTDSEGVFSMGNNAYGQCGRKIVEDEVYSGSHVVHKIEGFDSGVTQVACGQDHSLFLTDRGSVYAFGWGADGQTGLFHHLSVIISVSFLCIFQKNVSRQHAVTHDCSLYLQLASVTEATQMSSPRLLPLRGVGRVRQAACGGTQVAVLNEEGEVFVWGFGILGKGPKLSESAIPERVPATFFGRSEFNPTVKVSSIRCGLNHFAAITDRCELFVWGKNVRGCLGIGKHDDQYFPWRVTVPGHVTDVACGVDHMVALVKSII